MVIPVKTKMSPPPSNGRLTVLLHADDFGMSDWVNAGIGRAFDEGLLTGTSLMANGPAAERALDLWRELDRRRREDILPSRAMRRSVGDQAARFDLGIHLNLTEGRPLSRGFPSVFTDANGCFLGIRRLFPRLLLFGRKHRDAIEAELREQISFLVERGIRPDHLNGHEYVETAPVVGPIVVRLAKEYAIPYVRRAVELRPLVGLRHGRHSSADYVLAAVKQAFAKRFGRRLRAAGFATNDAFVGANHAGEIRLPLLQALIPQAVVRGIRRLEIGLHPADPAPAESPHAIDGWHDPLATRRPEEARLLRDEALAGLLQQTCCRLGRMHEASKGPSTSQAAPRRTMIPAA
ncbi:MAG: ChbG/HpnK family deacetylase [Planctomycetota bacterium]|nr:MAG: ChbG/HpnK family deacetylase [Planctomycetota bacterium]